MISYKTGFGFDIHRLEKGNGFYLAHIKINCNYSIVAHSDGDILLHALTDSILSSIGENDIGYFFPDSDEKTKNISSVDILNKALELLNNKGYKIENIAIIIVLEKVKLTPYREQMKESLSKLLNLSVDNISLHFKTNEGLDSIGENKAISAYSNVCIIKED